MASAFSRGRGNRADRVPAGIDLAMAGTLGMADRVRFQTSYPIGCLFALAQVGPYHARHCGQRLAEIDNRRVTAAM